MIMFKVSRVPELKGEKEERFDGIGIEGKRKRIKRRRIEGASRLYQ